MLSAENLSQGAKRYLTTGKTQQRLQSYHILHQVNKFDHFHVMHLLSLLIRGFNSFKWSDYIS